MLGRREQTTAGRGGVGSRMVMRIGDGAARREKPFRRRGRAARLTPGSHGAPPRAPALAHRVGQRHQVILVGMGGQRAGVAHEFPTARRGDPAGMADAQIPGMRFSHGSERTYHRRRVRVDERQRRHGIVRTPGPAAATGNVHDRKAIVRKRRAKRRTRATGRAAMCNRYHRRVGDSRSSPRSGRSGGRSAGPAAHRATRRGRDIRGPLLPPTVPGWRSRAERFDMAVLEAYEPIERRWQDRVSDLDVAVDEIPRIAAKDPRQRAVAARGHRRRADRACPVDPRRRRCPRQRHAGTNCVVPQANRATGEGHRRTRRIAA